MPRHSSPRTLAIYRFSLRTLLLLTTLLAVALGLFVWSTSHTSATPPLDHVDVPIF